MQRGGVVRRSIDTSFSAENQKARKRTRKRGHSVKETTVSS
jgi:hypothetical protein